MMRTIYLEGEMGQKFGTEFQIYAETVADALKCLEVNFSNFKEYFIDCHNKEIGFFIQVGENGLDYEAETLIPFDEGDIIITPAPAGSKSGIAKLLAALALVILVVATGGFGAGSGMAGVKAALAGGAGMSSILTYTALSMALQLAMTGIMQMMAPDPATDSDQPEAYLFNGSQQNVIEGDPVPILYGRLRVPGIPMAFDLTPNRAQGQTSYFGVNGASGGAGSNSGGFEALQ